MSASIFGDFLILWLQVEDGVSFLVPVLDEIRLDAGLQESSSVVLDRLSWPGSRERWRGGQRGAARTDFPTGGTGLWTVVDVARMADRVSTTLVKATTDQSQADW